MKTKKIWVLIIAFAGSTGLYAQEAEAAVPAAPTGFSTTDLLIWLVGWLVLLLVFLVVAQLGLVSRTMHAVRNQIRAEQGLKPLPPPMDLQAYYHKYFTGLKPMTAPENQIMEEDHEYDGIRELSNGMPPWLSLLFGGTFLFAVFYFSWFIVSAVGPSQEQEYMAEMAEGDSIKKAYRMAMANAMDEHSVEISEDLADLAEGKKIYLDKCASCHGNAGEGGVGPNLTDAYWLHGGGIKDLFRTITYGVPEKGMIAWNEQLMPGEIRNISSFILKELVGTTPPNGKAPQGALWTEAPADSTTLPVDTTQVLVSALHP